MKLLGPEHRGALFAACIVLTLLFRFWFAAVLPITGDEAYFIWWGLRPDWGFYDHPPMIGWWLAALLAISDSEWWLRLPSVVQPVFLALAARWALPRLFDNIDAAHRDSIGLLILLAPANVWNIAVTTDTALVYFSVLSGLAWLRAARDDDMQWYFVSGVLLAGAVLSKYFVAILGFAYLVDVLLRRTKGAWLGLALTYALCVPALGLMAWWNSANCWPNFMFNFVNRHEGAGWSATTPLFYAASVLYLLTPAAVWVAVGWYRRRIGARRSRHPAMQSPSTNWHPSTLSVLVIVPFGLFAILSLVKQIGLHWMLSFVPFVLIWLVVHLSAPVRQKLERFFVGFAVLQILITVAISLIPLETWEKNRRYSSVVLTVAHKELSAALGPALADQEKRWVLAMDGYSNAVTLGYNLRHYVAVFGVASSHARHDDILTDFSGLGGRNFLILRKSEPDSLYYRQFFKNVAIDVITVRGAKFWQVKGEGFDYAAYREKVLISVKQKYYAIPEWLPQRGCYFCDRYFPDEKCCR
jgi:Dolichyl-phosphate-mannose-protein mannosyltransferase